MAAETSDNPRRATPAPGRGAFERLRVYRRIHVRLTAIYGAALLLVLTPAAFVVYHLALAAERIRAIHARLRVEAYFATPSEGRVVMEAVEV